MSFNPSRFIFTSLAAGSFLMLASASAQAQTALAAAQDFIYNTNDRYPDGVLDDGVTDANAWGSPSSIDWSLYTGVTRGASFFTLTLMHGRGFTSQNIICLWNQGGSPSSNNYYQDIVGGVRFTRITKVNQIQPDDIMVINVTADYPSGHTMIIEEAPTILTTPIKPFVAGTSQYVMTILDSTNDTHGCGDSRWIGPCPPLSGGIFDPGAGRAQVRLYVDPSGNLVGHTWSSTASNVSYYDQATRPYAIGRLTIPSPLTCL